MADELNIIDKSLLEHHSIKENVKQAGAAMNDIEAQFLLRQAYSAWSQSSKEQMAARRTQLIEAIAKLEEGLLRHYAYEEKYLPGMCGPLIVKGLVHEHKAIQKQMEHARRFIGEMKLEGLDQPQLFNLKNQIQETVNQLLSLVEEHSSHEETLLKMMKECL